jgi:DNA-binding CsgD family transcriptional regulator
LTELGIGVPLAINMSTRNLHDLTLPDRIERRLRDGDMPAQHLCIEIVESAAVEDASPTMDILSRLRLKGMEISIDDFGAGYSSLKLLLRMPFSEIKIDRSFVADLPTSPDAKLIVKSIIDLAANMGISCVAAGVGTEEVAGLLERLGVSNLQGDLIAHPMPVEAVAAWWAIWSQSDVAASRNQEQGPTPTPARGSCDDESVDASASPLPGKTSERAVRLPPRQLEVMRLLAEGCPIKEIARRLNLGVGTVKVHLSLAYSALGAHNRTEAIRRAGSTLLRPATEAGADKDRPRPNG